MRGGPARPDSPDRYAELRALLGTPVPRGTNVAIASHGNPFYGVAGPPYLAEGEMAVVEPLGDSRFRIVARVRKDDWEALRIADRGRTRRMVVERHLQDLDHVHTNWTHRASRKRSSLRELWRALSTEAV